jgi:plasmid stabilization system protein ParE
LKLVWQDQARAELREALIYYRDHANQSIAQDFNAAVMRVANQLIQFPELGIRTVHAARRFPLHDYPYSLVYRAGSTEITLIAVAHHSRRPGYWAGRR